ncbi:substrate-binding domain-containing protein [Rhizobium sp. 9T]|uniref:Substrate-binding domain-containing protein n=1 Tax=Rhizobium croatiense TaxID=2867516 RepID=A0ABS7M270_9HYPH|nr:MULTISPECIES: substrate-binding domain-containing protein [Rhizobium]MBY4606969.1 substrate-binding domain-containing protein [Rhizobium croatiense]MBY4630927.1 substrate-binding domain-containing protein [Rhizobium croatiense]PDV89730.1 ABC transporter substrate-binding protein [Rhizobium sp. H4]WET75597.1 substrate-binding domain-containing protein [Rhizobium croatiense]
MKRIFAAAIAATLSAGIAAAQELKPLNSDSEPDRMDWSVLEANLGTLPKLPEGLKVGGVSKTLTNEYWRSLGEGYQKFADKVGVSVAYQAAQSEGDQLGQLTIAEGMVTQGYKVLLVSPQTDANLQPVIEQAKAAKVPVVNVNDAVIPQAEHYVGNVQRDNGVRVAKWFIEKRPSGGKVAIIEGQAGVYAAVQRTDGFKKTIEDGGKFQVVASVPGNWDRQMSYDAATNILQQHPDLVGFYCNNDGMALGVVEAVKAAGLQEKVVVFGTDGISDAYKSIAAGELTGTVDSFPVLTGEVAMEVALRLVSGQQLPRVIATPQALITKDNYTQFQGSPDEIRAVLMKAASK